MQPRKLSLAIARYPYGGTGSTSSEVPDVGDWLVENILWAKSDPRISDVFHERFSDTPITMTRNASVVWAKKAGADLLLMVDSDMKPDLYLGEDPKAKPFLESSFNYIYDHYGKGPTVVAAPYGGPPPHENSYLFRWRNFQTDNPDPTGFKLDQYTRDEASVESGIKEVAALPTGLILWDMRAFDLVDARGQGWFYYEWMDEFASRKASTEDVTATRDISLAGLMQLGYNPILCNWDSWAGHWKPKCVGKPTQLTAGVLSKNVMSAIQRDWCGDGALMSLARPAGLPPATEPEVLGV